MTSGMLESKVIRPPFSIISKIQIQHQKSGFALPLTGDTVGDYGDGPHTCAFVKLHESSQAGAAQSIRLISRVANDFNERIFHIHFTESMSKPQRLVENFLTSKTKYHEKKKKILQSQSSKMR